MTTVLITGTSGKLGRELRDHLSAMDGVVLRLTDKRPGDDDLIAQADLATRSQGWAGLLGGVNIVVHLAANADPAARWPELVAANVDAPLNLYLEAARHGVSHIVLASSIWVAAARRDDRGPIAADDADPGGSAYGASKLFAERIAHAFWLAHGVGTTILRIGAFTPEPRPAPASDWDRAARLSRRDLCHAVELAVRDATDGVRTVNLISHNEDPRFTLDEARDLLGFVPQDRFADTRRGDLLARAIGRIRRLIKRG